MNFTTAKIIEDHDLCRAYLVCLEERTMEESTSAFWDRFLQSFVNSNGNDQGRTQCISETF